MKYFKISAGSEKTNFCEPHICEDNAWANVGLYYNKCIEEYKLPIPFIVKNKNEPEDFLLSDANLVSSRFLTIIKQMNSDIKAFESELFYKNEKIWDIFYTLIFPEYSFFNWEKSDYEADENEKTGEKDIWLLRKLVLDKAKELNISNLNNFFVLKEDPLTIICTEIAKNAIEEAGLTGVNFRELEVM